MTPQPAYEYLARVERVVAGDTVDLSLELGFGIELRERRCFLAGIQAPLEGTSGGLAAAAHLTTLLEAYTWERPRQHGRWLLVRSLRGAVFGDLLELELDGVDRGAIRVHLNTLMVEHGHALPKVEE